MPRVGLARPARRQLGEAALESRAMMLHAFTNRRCLAPLLVPLLVLGWLVCHGVLAGAHGPAQVDGPSPAPLAPQNPDTPEGGSVAGEHSAEYLPRASYGAALLLALATIFFLLPPPTVRRLRAALTGAKPSPLAFPSEPARAPAAPLLQVFRL